MRPARTRRRVAGGLIQRRDVATLRQYTYDCLGVIRYNRGCPSYVTRVRNPRGWRYRLTVRTEPSQGLNRGSIPLSATKFTAR